MERGCRNARGLRPQAAGGARHAAELHQQQRRRYEPRRSPSMDVCATSSLLPTIHDPEPTARLCNFKASAETCILNVAVRLVLSQSPNAASNAYTRLVLISGPVVLEILRTRTSTECRAFLQAPLCMRMRSAACPSPAHVRPFGSFRGHDFCPPTYWSSNPTLLRCSVYPRRVLGQSDTRRSTHWHCSRRCSRDTIAPLRNPHQTACRRLAEGMRTIPAASLCLRIHSLPAA
ncbi:hypothetical protein LXA43DRAFT_477191 [Ganoderma leucocontextum]|nr:hypothetical protein LXA43DRAFT_477191 [Ganoderma leucocontextum]